MHTLLPIPQVIDLQRICGKNLMLAYDVMIDRISSDPMLFIFILIIIDVIWMMLVILAKQQRRFDFKTPFQRSIIFAMGIIIMLNLLSMFITRWNIVFWMIFVHPAAIYLGDCLSKRRKRKMKIH